jgi:hypothetical protein
MFTAYVVAVFAMILSACAALTLFHFAGHLDG